MTVYQRPAQTVDARQWNGEPEQARELMKWMGSGAGFTPPTKDDPRTTLTVPTPLGPKPIKPYDWIVLAGENEFLSYPDSVFHQTFEQVTDGEEKPHIKHARAELARFGNEDPNFIESIVSAMKGFLSFGHSGASAGIAKHILGDLLELRNLLPLTNDPEEWELHSEDVSGVPGGLWQSRRNAEAFSIDGGKTFYLVGDKDSGYDKPETHIETQDKDFVPEIDPEDLESDTTPKEGEDG